MRMVFSLIPLLLALSGHAQTVNFENFGQAANQWLALDGNSTIATIWDRQLEANGVGIVMPTFLQEKGWKIHHTSNYTNNMPWPKGVSLRKISQAPHKEEFLTGAYQFISNGDKKLILIKGYNAFSLYYNSKDKKSYQDALDFHKEFLAYFQENSPYKGKALEFNGAIDFLTGVDSSKFKWKDFIFPMDKKQKIIDTIDNFIGKYNADDWDRYNLPDSRGVILYGPPGTGKSLVASVLISNVLNKRYKNEVTYLHVQARNIGRATDIRNLYQVARAYSPSIVFFEDIDLISGTDRTDLADVKNELMQQLSGLETLKGVLTIGTTNYFDRIDYALKRSKRLGFHFEIGHPGFESRSKLFKLFLDKKKIHVSGDVDYTLLAERSEGFTGADIKEVVDIAIQQGTKITDETVDIRIGHALLEKIVAKKKTNADKESL